MVKLREYQIKGRDFLASRKYAMLADEMGVGKTLQAIFALKEIEAKTAIIICPANLKNQWFNELNTHANASIQIIHKGTDDIRFGTQVIIINYELLLYKDRKTNKYEMFKKIHEWVRTNKIDACILDESHYLKDHSSIRTRFLLGRQSFFEYCRYVWLLTGTPVLNRPIELFSILRTFAPGLLGKYTNWVWYGRRYCGGDKVAFKGASNVDELATLLQNFMLRRLKTDVLSELPLIQEQVIEIDAPTPELSEADTPLPTLRRHIALNRLPNSIKFIKDTLHNVNKLLIFAYHREIIETLEKELSEYWPRVIYGGMSKKDKEDSLNDFISGRCQVLIGQIGTIGQGVDGLQQVCSHVIFYEIDWSPGILSQAISRLHRMGQAECVSIYYLVQPGTYETRIYNIVNKKQRTITKLLKDEREPKQMNPQVMQNAVEAVVKVTETLHVLKNLIEQLMPEGQLLEAQQTEAKKRGRKPKEAPDVSVAPVAMETQTEFTVVETLDEPQTQADFDEQTNTSVVLTLEEVVDSSQKYMNSGMEQGISRDDLALYARSVILKKYKDPEGKLIGKVRDAQEKDYLSLYNDFLMARVEKIKEFLAKQAEKTGEI